MNEFKTMTAEASPAERDTARRKAQDLFSVHDQRTALVKEMVAKENASTDEKTARLRALRLAKEAADRASGVLPAEPRKPVRKRSPRKIIRA